MIQQRHTRIHTQAHSHSVPSSAGTVGSLRVEGGSQELRVCACVKRTAEGSVLETAGLTDPQEGCSLSVLEPSNRFCSFFGGADSQWSLLRRIGCVLVPGVSVGSVTDSEIPSGGTQHCTPHLCLRGFGGYSWSPLLRPWILYSSPVPVLVLGQPEPWLASPGRDPADPPTTTGSWAVLVSNGNAAGLGAEAGQPPAGVIKKI